MADKIIVTAEIVTFEPNAMSDSFDDGSFQTFDASKIRLLAPEEYFDKYLLIYHDGEVEESSVWRRLGTKIRAEIKVDDLRGHDPVFAAALDKFEVVENP